MGWDSSLATKVWTCNFGLRFILLGHVQFLLLLLSAGEEQRFENES